MIQPDVPPELRAYLGGGELWVREDQTEDEIEFALVLWDALDEIVDWETGDTMWSRVGKTLIITKNDEEDEE
jgi:hypothetical protein